MGKLSAEERPVIGQLANKVRADIENALNKRKEELKSKMEQVRLTEEAIDVTQRAPVRFCTGALFIPSACGRPRA